MGKCCLDFGHGGKDSGAVNGSRYEKNDVVKLGNKVDKLLKYNGESVILTRNGDKTVGLSARADISNDNKCDYFISIHRNSFSKNTAKGFEVFSYPNSIKGKDLALDVYKEVNKEKLFTPRGVKAENFAVLRETKCAAILVEVGFISNSKDNEIFDKYLDRISEAIVRGICVNRGKKFKKPSDDPKPNNAKVTYRVVCGSFENKENANKRLADVEKKTGYECFLIAERI